MITLKRLRGLLDYNHITGVFTCLKDIRKRLKVGDTVTTLQSEGYNIIFLEGTHYLLQDLAMYYMTGAYPQRDVEHINGIRTDNRYANLK